MSAAAQKPAPLPYCTPMDLPRILPGVSRSLAYEISREVGRRVGRRILIRLDDLERWIATRPRARDTMRRKKPAAEMPGGAS
jgi:hypothetical protein